MQAPAEQNLAPPFQVAPSENGRANNPEQEESVPLPFGLQPIHLSQEAADTIQTILDDPGHPTFAGR